MARKSKSELIVAELKLEALKVRNCLNLNQLDKKSACWILDSFVRLADKVAQEDIIDLESFLLEKIGFYRYDNVTNIAAIKRISEADKIKIGIAEYE